jgi:hypothetical protein
LLISPNFETNKLFLLGELTMTTYFENKDQYIAFRNAWKQASHSAREKGWIQAAHHVLLNVLRGRSVDNGFTPITNKNKLANGAYINHGLYFAVSDLKRMIQSAQSDKLSDWQKSRLEDFLAPFNGTVTVEMLAKVTLPNIQPLESNFGQGRKVAQKIMSGEAKPITYQDIQDLYEDVA